MSLNSFSVSSVGYSWSRLTRAENCLHPQGNGEGQLKNFSQLLSIVMDSRLVRWTRTSNQLKLFCFKKNKQKNSCTYQQLFQTTGIDNEVVLGIENSYNITNSGIWGFSLCTTLPFIFYLSLFNR